MEKFLYLTEREWADTWINGGSIPIKVASSYLSDSRNGIMTPDENLIHKSEVAIPSLRQHGISIEGSKNITITNCHSNGFRIPDIINASYYKEDGLILSFCNHFSKDTALRLNKKVCVKITSMKNLKRIIDKQLGCRGIMEECKYTNDHQRNHFLKFSEDAWQDEFRIFWNTTKEKLVNIPIGTAELVWVLE